MTIEELYNEYKLEVAKAIKAMQELRDKMEEEKVQYEKLADTISNLKRITSEIKNNFNL